MRAVERQDRTVATADQILGEIRDYCRTTQTAESTFGRLVVNDGKLVSRLRDGARITTGTLDKVRAYLSEHRSAPSSAPSKPSAAKKPVNGTIAATDAAPAGFRFFDNRQKYLLFVSTCSEKTDVANRISLEIGNLQPSPPALRIFDAGVGDGTVLSRVMRALHARFPTMPLYVVAKEISYEDVRLTLEKMADRLFEHPATVLVITNLYYAEAPWLTPRSATAAQSLIWKDVALSGNTAHGFAEQIGELEGFLAENWRAGISPTTGNPVYTRPIILTLRREDHSFRPEGPEAGVVHRLSQRRWRRLSGDRERLGEDHPALDGAGGRSRRPARRRRSPGCRDRGRAGARSRREDARRACGASVLAPARARPQASL